MHRMYGTNEVTATAPICLAWQQVVSREAQVSVVVVKVRLVETKLHLWIARPKKHWLLCSITSIHPVYINAHSNNTCIKVW